MTVREVDMRGPLAIVIGNQGRGLNARVRRRVDVMARIPMRGRVASLNASVAGSVFLFEASAQRGLPEAERAADQPPDAPPAVDTEAGAAAERGDEAGRSGQQEPGEPLAPPAEADDTAGTAALRGGADDDRVGDAGDEALLPEAPPVDPRD